MGFCYYDYNFKLSQGVPWKEFPSERRTTQRGQKSNVAGRQNETFPSEENRRFGGEGTTDTSSYLEIEDRSEGISFGRDFIQNESATERKSSLRKPPA